METAATGQPLSRLTDVNEADWARLGQRRIFFGHQSVGTNIMAGVTAVLAEHPKIRLSVVESKDILNAPAGIVHAKVGRNTHPDLKLDEFVRLSEQMPDKGVAMLKFCYVDVTAATDPAALFEQYRQRIDELRQRQPGLTIVHVTMPLTISESWKGRLKSRVLRRPTLNAVRNRYNELVRRAYLGREPLFDLARLEATTPDGRRAFYQLGGDTVDVLVNDYTEDGSHLNDAAQRRVAEQFLITLARVGDSGSKVAAR
jgi:hypothetical protein